ncbi:DUF4423 domain-containing protein [uncultured Bdellovibrio sp.]|uniref:DUF4423 domain-containing protein n=1 Tax=Bdellovibrio sp. HCB-162 TaxID=3394234 RepID=UPI0025F3CFE5|nr:DUF4423 domain-containing protein [uncultured Bdellovibrio sp.]
MKKITTSLTDKFYTSKLLEEFHRKKRKNPRYSLRSYANFLGLNSGTLSSILQGKRPLPQKDIETVVHKLKLTANEKRLFIESIHKNSAITPKESFCLNSDHLQIIFNEWEYFVILAVFKLDDFESSPKWIHRKTKIPVDRIQTCLNVLLSSGLIKRNETGELVRSQKALHTTHGIPSEAIRHAHKNNLRMSLEKLEQTPIEERDFNFFTVALDKTRYNKLKKIILKFRDELSRLDDLSKKHRVYRVGVQLFPLSYD